jgi:hypothetical protein
MGSKDTALPFAFMAPVASSAQIALWQAGNHWNAVAPRVAMESASPENALDANLHEGGLSDFPK